MNPTDPSPANLDVYHHDFHPHATTTKTSFWRKLGGGSLSLSLIIHGVILAVGLVLIIQVIPQPKTPPPDIEPSGRGGNAAPSLKNSPSKRAVPMAVAKITSAGVADITLPPTESSAVAALPNLTSGTLIGSGLGKTPDKGNGLNPGNGLKPGLTGTGDTKIPVFGRTEPSANALTGTFYDLKQDKRHQTTSLGEKTDWNQITVQLRGILHQFVKRGWNERLLDDYFQAGQKLYQTKIFLPAMNADAAPKAFGQENIPGSRWVVVYRGTVKPPKSGRFRFVGAGDDFLAVRFNGKTVFDFGYDSVTADIRLAGQQAKLTNSPRADKEWDRVRKDFIMPEPVTIHRYDTLSPWHRRDLGGLAVGPWFEAKEDGEYPIEILLSEAPGGYFFGYLLIEEEGATYRKTPEGSPILPLFRLDDQVPSVAQPGPVFEPDGPVWKLSGPGKPRI
jgi:hypothetical protein